MKSVESTSSKGLQGDPRRRADAVVRGFIYQFWRTVEAWIELDPEELLYVEGAEDFDIIGCDEAMPVQVKDDKSSGPLTLASANALAAIGNFWKVRRDNPGRTIRFKFITTAEAGTERSGFDGEKGIDVWNLCRQSPLPACIERVEEIRSSLLKAKFLDRDLALFVKNASAEEIKQQLIGPLEWLYKQPSLDNVQEIIIGRLLKLGEARGLTARDSSHLGERLCMVVAKAATAKSPQRLDFIAFRAELDRSVNIEIPREALRQPEDYAGALSHLVSAAVKSSGEEVPEITSATDTFATPVLPATSWPRQEFIQRVRAALAECIVYLDGSAGMGKTTLVLQALESNKRVLWANLRESTVRDMADVCRVLAHQVVGAASDSAIVVLDDLNPQDDPRTLERDLGRLAATIRNHGGALVITSYRAAGPRMASIIGLSNNGQISVLPFAEEEIFGALMMERCAEQRARALARIIWLHTSGHPQLVAARVSALKAAGFPKLSLDDLIDRPKEIQDAQVEALAVVRAVLPENVRSLLYRLSLALPSLRRSHALRIGAAAPPISHTGEAFDQLVGPWLEQPISGHYRISALVSGAGQQVLPPDEVKKLHADIASALLAEKKLTLDEFAGIVAHALSGEAEAQIAIASKAFLTAPKEIKEALAQRLSWVAKVGVDPGTHLRLSNRSARQFFRLLQWEIAGITARGDLASLAQKMEADFALGSGQLVEALPRILYLAKLLIQTEFSIPPDRIVAHVLEFCRLSQSAAKKDPALNIGADMAPMYPGVKRSYLADLFAAVLLPRVRTISNLRVLISALDSLEDEDQQMLLDGFTTDDGELRFLFNAPWLSVKRGDDKSYEDCAEALAEALSAGRRWHHHPWMRAAARARSAVLDEMLDRRQDAERVVIETANEIGSSLNLDEQMAIIAFNHGEYDKALSVWQRVLPKWTSDSTVHDRQPLYSTRYAAIAAANLGRWDVAAELFNDAIKRAQKFTMRSWMLGLLADRGYALWRNNDRKQAVAAFSKVVAATEKLPNKPESFSEYAMQKLIGYTLAALAIPDQSLPLPVPGMCSDPNPHQGIKELPPTPAVYAWFLVYRLAGEAGDRKLATQCAQKFENAPFSFLRARFTLDVLCRRLQSRSLHGVLELATKVAVDMDMALQRKDMPPAEPDPPGLTAELSMRSVNMYIRPALWAGMLRAKVLGRNLTKLVESWRREIDAAQPYIAQELDLCQKFSRLDIAELSIVLKNTQEPLQSRFLAAALLLGREDCSPSEALYAQAILVDRAKDYEVLWNSAGESFDILVRKDWQRFTDNPFQLRSPRLYVDTIRKACQSKNCGWSAAANIIRAAIPTVQVNFPDTILKKLEELAPEASTSG